MNVPELARAIVDRIDLKAMEQNANLFAEVWAAKFFRVEEYAHRAAEKAFALGLHHGPPRRILDIGCGFGYLCLAAEALGHRATGIDIPHPCMAAVAQAVPFEFVPLEIKKFTRIDRPRGSLDLIVMIGVNMMDMPEGRWWGVAEYQALFEDLRGLLSPGGILHVEFNRGAETDFLGTTNWRGLHTIDGNVIRFQVA